MEVLNLDKDWLYEKYIVEKLSSHKIAKLIGCGAKSITRYLHLYGIPVRTNTDSQRLNRTGSYVPCLVCGKEVYRKKNQLEKFDRFFCSWDCAKEYQATGSENWRATRQYKDWRRRIIDRDGYCVLCGSSYDLIAHHILQAKDRKDLRYEIDNGITLCEDCHKRVHQEGSENYIESLQEVILVEKLRISEKL